MQLMARGDVGMIKKVLRSSIVESGAALGIRISSAVASYAMFTLISRYLGPENFGHFTISFSLAMGLGLFGAFGQQIFILKEVPRARLEGDSSGQKGVYLFAIYSTIVCSTIASAIFLIWSSYSGSAFAPVALGGAILTMLFGMSQTAIGALRVQNRTLYAMASRDLIWRLAAIVVVYSASVPRELFDGDQKVALVMLALAGALMPIVVLHIVEIGRHLATEFRAVPARFELRSWFDTSLGLLLVSLISSADLFVFTLAVGSLVGPTEAGAFFAALKTVELLNIFLMAVTLIVSSQISEAVAKNDRVAFQRICNKAIIIQGIPCVIAALVVIIWSSEFMAVFDPNFASYGDLLRLLAVGMLINALTGATVLILQLIGKHWTQVLAQGGSLVLSVLILPVMCSYLGIYGVAVGFILSKLIWNVSAIIIILRHSGVDPSFFGLLRRNTGGIAAAFNDVVSEIRVGRGS